MFQPTVNRENYYLKIAYDGTGYGGWQIQPNTVTIQALLEEKMQLLLKTPIKLAGQGRTDAGVHALGQTAHFHFAGTIDTFLFLKAINALLPHQIRVLEIKRVPLTFHARFSATKKVYHYYITTQIVQLPFDKKFRWHFYYPLNFDKIERSAQLFVGTKDFSAFANKAHQGSAKNNPIKTLYRVDVVKEPMGFCIQLEGNGFLYKMCRNIVGTLVDVGRGRSHGCDIERLFQTKDRKQTPMAAPPHGLFLMEVTYPEHFFSKA